MTSRKFGDFPTPPSPSTPPLPLYHTKLPVLLSPSYIMSLKCQPTHPACVTSFINSPLTLLCTLLRSQLWIILWPLLCTVKDLFDSMHFGVIWHWKCCLMRSFAIWIRVITVYKIYWICTHLPQKCVVSWLWRCKSQFEKQFVYLPPKI